MSETNQSLEEILFDLAVQKPTAAERAAFLDGVCRGNPALRAALDELFEAHFGAAGFLPKLAAQPSGQPAASLRHPEELPAEMIGRYKLLEKIGEGGFGEVWMAEQREPVKRRLALKIIKLGMDTKQVVARFEAERQALALMGHPNIAKVLDAGATENGRPYFVMELVRGTRITDYCDKNKLPTEDRLKLFILVCQAIQHAHQKGIIHRDIKPSNILVTLHDGVPVPKIIDFGIAEATQFELTDKTLFTQFQQFIGTPAYISPEQAEMSGLDVDTRADIYSLGVLLYELLVGQTPFDAKEMVKGGIDALRQIIREREPLKPSTKLKTLPVVDVTTTAQRRQTNPSHLTRQLRGDLDWIVMKCLEKDRARRYDTANGLALDIQRYLGNEPVTARPPSALYRIRKTVRRNRLAFAAGTLVFVALLLGISGVALVQYRANQDYRRRLYVSEVNRAGLAWQAGRTAEMRELLERCPADLRHWEWHFLHQQLDRWESKPLFAAQSFGATALSADRDLLVVAADGAIQVRAFPSGQWLRNLPSDGAGNGPFALAPRGDLLAMADARAGGITIWNARTGERVGGISNAMASVLVWAHDGWRLVTSSGDVVQVWNAATSQEERSFTTTAPVLALAFAPDDSTLAVGTKERNIDLIDPATGTLRRQLQTRGPFFGLLTFSPDSRLLVAANGTAGGFKRDHRVWNLEDGGSLDLNTGAEASAFSFSADSRRLAVGDVLGMIQVWDLDRRAEVERFSAHQGHTTSVHLLPEDRILSGSPDGLKLWQARRPGVTALKGYHNSLRTMAFSPDNRWLTASGLGRELLVWDARSGLHAGTYQGHSRAAFAVAFSRDGLVASADADRQVQLWDPVSREMKWNKSIESAGAAYWLAFSPDGRRLYLASAQDTLTVLDAVTGDQLSSTNFMASLNDGLAVSPDGRLLALCQKVKLRVLCADGLQELWSADAQPNRCAAFSPDGRWLATGDNDGTVSLWEVASGGRVRRSLRGHGAAVTGVGFHPDGRRLVSSSFDGQVKLWDWRAGVEMLTLPTPAGVMLWHAAFSPDGRMIAAAGGDGVVTLWKVE